VEELLEWPWKRFDRFYDAFMRRQLIERLERRKEDMIAALWANSGFEKSEDRTNAIAEIEDNYEQMLRKLLGLDVEEEIDPNNPFFSAGERGLKRLEQPRDDEGTVKEVIDYSREIDQG
jgi:hypothetical protein